jgi:hypothetical protein
VIVVVATTRRRRDDAIAKEDVPPLPLRPPKKRRQMESALDIHLAMWASSDNLTPSDKRRVEEERERRKRAKRTTERIGIILAKEGMTPEQYAKLADTLNGERSSMSAIWHVWSRGPLYKLCRTYGVDLEVLREGSEEWRAERTVIHNATKVIVIVNGESGPVWEMVRYAKHRNTPVRVIMPNGERR